MWNWPQQTAACSTRLKSGDRTVTHIAKVRAVKQANKLKPSVVQLGPVEPCDNLELIREDALHPPHPHLLALFALWKVLEIDAGTLKPRVSKLRLQGP